ncbi:MAG: hypothetical protein D3904_00645 [Candidatus Electrothrix sp. EH2]|nr:hypothetical protein [Candidatus Electrothrix sp. EH2]
MISLRANLAKIGITNDPVSFPSGFYSAPTSLRTAIRAMENPHPEKWWITYDPEYNNKDWTEEAQGLTHDFNNWFFSSNNHYHGSKRRVWKFDPFSKIKDQSGKYVKFGTKNGHLGDIDYYDGFIWCALEGPVQVGQVPPDSMDWINRYNLCDSSGGPPPQSSMPWCAFNPWNGLLYSSNNGDDGPGEDIMYAYRFTGSEFRSVPEANIKLQVKTKSIQGGVFSDNGHLLIASNHSDDIRVFSALNGYYYGGVHIQVNHSARVSEEVEGLTIWKNIAYQGVNTHVHLFLLDNDSPDEDDVIFKHFVVPDWGVL